MGLLQDLKSHLTEQRIAWLIRRNTMVGPALIQNLSRLAQSIEEEQIPGDVVECGVYKRGTAAILARLATHSCLPRTVWLFDSFQGMPKATAADGPEAPVGSAVLPPAPVGWRASFTAPARTSLASVSSPAFSRTPFPPSTSRKSPS
jgi:hypothetical protein